MTRVMTNVNYLNTHGEEMENQKVIENVLRTLAIKFDVVVTTIEEAKYLS